MTHLTHPTDSQTANTRRATWTSQALNHVLLVNIDAAIDPVAFCALDGLPARKEALFDSLKFLSEALITIHFSGLRTPAALRALDSCRAVLLHNDSLRTMRVDPFNLTWALNAVALLHPHFELGAARAFVLDMADRYGLAVPDSPSYRDEENHYLYGMLTGCRYRPAVDVAYERNFYRFNTDQAYALTHLLFYRNDYGSRRVTLRSGTRFVLEHLAIEAYTGQNLDVLLEVMVNYKALHNADPAALSVFETMAAELIADNEELRHALTEEGSEHFAKWYHQIMLCGLYRTGWKPEGTGPASAEDLSTREELVAMHEFHTSLRSANYTKPACLFPALQVSAPRLAFARTNLDNYFAIQSYDFAPGQPQSVGTQGAVFFCR